MRAGKGPQFGSRAPHPIRAGNAHPQPLSRTGERRDCEQWVRVGPLSPDARGKITEF